MEKEEIESIKYLEQRVKNQNREILTLKQSLTDCHAEDRANKETIKALENTNERLLKVIEKQT